MRSFATIALGSLSAACGGTPDVIGAWDGTEVDGYRLLADGGVGNDFRDRYPLEDPDAGTGERFAMTFTESFARLVWETYALDTDPIEVLEATEDTYGWRAKGEVVLKLEGDVAEGTECNLVAGPDTLVCNFEREQHRDTQVTSLRLARRRR